MTNREERQKQIETAALDLLREKGYRSTSMLQIAKKAKASNQTLYAWYGNKQTLFKSIIERNGALVRRHLQDALSASSNPLSALETLGPLLLGYACGEQAIIISRAAVTDASETGLLGEAVEEVARDTVVPLIKSLMERLEKSGDFTFGSDAQDAAETYVALLFGELQIRLARGNIAPLNDDAINKRAARAFALTCRLFASDP
ncbi:transcriptional regulator, TetR family [Cohaesibacter sp. ES.047]|uniref:TetR/AcrR family transcriptional regulator n=1 Tax=Cohaesibacter sp. ES.047 TaxID=1798205 RepID=UPI000BC0BC7D|nr:TetR/AcrR family transcriptional regulator [Cohaesibacter sp. ES.047]SNY90954.1 transcriptional regulator, TetR family [Cohaesibacter sp. ES.047]